MDNEKVTVVIPVYNREKYIETAITSILKQTLKNWTGYYRKIYIE